MNGTVNVLKTIRHISQLTDEEALPLPFEPISADSHVSEPPNCYRGYIEPRYRDRAPYVAQAPNGGQIAEQTRHMSDQERRAILLDNALQAFNLSVE